MRGRTKVARETPLWKQQGDATFAGDEQILGHPDLANIWSGQYRLHSDLMCQLDLGWGILTNSTKKVSSLGRSLRSAVTPARTRGTPLLIARTEDGEATRAEPIRGLLFC